MTLLGASLRFIKIIIIIIIISFGFCLSPFILIYTYLVRYIHECIHVIVSSFYLKTRIVVMLLGASLRFFITSVHSHTCMSWHYRPRNHKQIVVRIYIIYLYAKSCTTRGRVADVATRSQTLLDVYKNTLMLVMVIKILFPAKLWEHVFKTNTLIDHHILTETAPCKREMSL